MTEAKSMGISKTMFIVGLIAAVLASSLISLVEVTQMPFMKGPKGDKGDTGATGATGPQGPAGSTTPALSAVFIDVQSGGDRPNPYIILRGYLVNFGSSIAYGLITFNFTINGGQYIRTYDCGPVEGDHIGNLWIQLWFPVQFSDYSFTYDVTWT